MNVYCLIVTDLHTKSSYIEAIYQDEDQAEDEREILESELGDEYTVDVESHSLVKQQSFNA